MDIIPIFDLYIKPTNYKGEYIDALFPQWWHKLLFWKKWTYPEFFIKIKRKSIHDL